jgi:CBS domain-containing protein
MVLRELDFEGPMTRRILTLVGLDNIASLLRFARITGPGVTCEPHTRLPEVIRIFEECHGEYSHLPVVDRSGDPRVIGVVDQRGAMVAYRRHGPAGS